MSTRFNVHLCLIGVVGLCLGVLGCPTDGLVAAPDCVGLNRAAAEAAIVGAGLTVGDVDEAYSDTVTVGLVISQNPTARQRVEPGSAVELTVSKGPEPSSVEVPDVVGMTQGNAEATLVADGLSAGTVTQAYSDTVASGRVISQDPEASSMVDAGTSVALVVSMGPEPLLVPSLVGMTQAAAGSALTDAGLRVGEVTLTNSDTVAAGLVISQDPVSGTSVTANTEVDLTVSLGPEMVTVPEVVGILQSEAEDDIADAGLTVGSVSMVTSDVIAAGYVISQSPEMDSEAPSGTAVNLEVVSGLTTDIQVPLAMVDIDGATFQMGDDSPARPVHSVTLTSYEMGVYEVTNAEFCAVLNWAVANGHLTGTTGDITYAGKLLVDIKTSPSEGTGARIEYVDGVFSPTATYGFARDLHPMTSVTWFGTLAFCNWLSEWSGLTPAYDLDTWKLVDTSPGDDGIQFTNGYRIPTEAEWEYAAAWDGATRYRYGFSSDTISLSRANYGGANPLDIKGYPYSTIVGYYNGLNEGTVDSRSPAGCYDMTGNVEEWCYDWLRSYPDEHLINPTGPDTVQTYKVIRGGWYSMAEGNSELTTTERDANYSGVEGTDLGFRICRSVELR